MARIIGSGPANGELRGSIGGVTYSRNRAGMYARQRVQPIQPQTASQVGARAAFRLAAQQWKNLDAGQQAAWNQLAAPGASSAIGLNGTAMVSGFQAYVSAYIGASRGAIEAVSTSLATTPTGVTVAPAAAQYAVSSTAPLAWLQANLNTDSGNSTLVVTAATLDANGAWAITVDLTVPDLLAIGVMQDQFATPWGVQAWLSDRVSSLGARSTGRVGRHVITGEILQVSVTPQAPVTSMVFTGTSPLPTPAYRYGLVAGSIHDLTVGAMSPGGMQTVLGVIRVTIQP